MHRLAWLSIVVACSHPPSPGDDVGDPPGGDPAPDAPASPRAPLEVTSLGVQGFVLAYGDDIVITAPMFTRQSAVEVTLGTPLPADAQAVAEGLAGLPLDKVRAVVSGHAHYDHLLDVPQVLALAPGARVYANASAQHALAALAPDRPAHCTSPAPATAIARDRVVAMDLAHVDYTNCPALRPAGADLEGSWVTAPGGRVRLKAFCSVHPDQIGPVHFGAGSIDVDQCELPRAASDWLEGLTLAFVIDFLDDTGAPVYRVFYQDAPTDAPIGHVPQAVLAEKQVDLALLCVGSYDAVVDHPMPVVTNLAPRFATSGHWEDFFRPRDATPQPIPFLDLPTYVARAEAAMAGTPEPGFLVDGNPAAGRHVLAQPGARLTVPHAAL
jgi:hypothetical protein